MIGNAVGALYFIVHTLLSMLLFVFMLRVLLQWARADFRNPLAQAVVKITNPLVMPLRRVLPPIGKVDTSSIVAVLIVAALGELILSLFTGGAYLADPLRFIKLIVIKLIWTTLNAYFWAVLIYSVLSMIAPGGYSPMQSLLGALCEPVLRPFRRIIPPIAGLDFSPLWACLAIQALLFFVRVA
jgi:YggT family protein